MLKIIGGFNSLLTLLKRRIATNDGHEDLTALTLQTISCGLTNYGMNFMTFCSLKSQSQANIIGSQSLLSERLIIMNGESLHKTSSMFLVDYNFLGICLQLFNHCF